MLVRAAEGGGCKPQAEGTASICCCGAGQGAHWSRARVLCRGKRCNRRELLEGWENVREPGPITLPGLGWQLSRACHTAAYSCLSSSGTFLTPLLLLRAPLLMSLLARCSPL